MDAYQFERTFVQLITEIATRQGINDAQLARRAWPHQKGAATAWRKMRNDTEKPKRLNLEEAFLLAQTIGLSMSDICGMVQGRLMDLPPSGMAKTKFLPVAGCVVLQRVGQPPKFEFPLCPTCKKQLSARDTAYICPTCGYTTNKKHTDEAIKRSKARMGLI